MHRILFKSSADRELRRLPESIQQRIVREVELLAENPRPPVRRRQDGGR